MVSEGDWVEIVAGVYANHSGRVIRTTPEKCVVAVEAGGRVAFEQMVMKTSVRVAPRRPAYPADLPPLDADPEDELDETTLAGAGPSAEFGRLTPDSPVEQLEAFIRTHRLPVPLSPNFAGPSRSRDMYNAIRGALAASPSTPLAGPSHVRVKKDESAATREQSKPSSGPAGSPASIRLADLSADSKLTQLREYIQQENLKITTSGKGRTTAAVYTDIVAAMKAKAARPSVDKHSSPSTKDEHKPSASASKGEASVHHVPPPVLLRFEDLSSASDMADLRAYIKQEKLSITTSGSGRTLAAIYGDIERAKQSGTSGRAASKAASGQVKVEQKSNGSKASSSAAASEQRRREQQELRPSDDDDSDDEEYKGEDVAAAERRQIPTRAVSEQRRRQLQQELSAAGLNAGAKLYDHQLEGVAWMLDREKSADGVCHGGILADDMGLGKTLQMLSLIVLSTPKNGGDAVHPTLLVCPLTLMDSWESEIKRQFKPDVISSYRWHGPGRITDPKRLARHTLVMTTYETMRGDVTANGSVLRGVEWHRLIADEAQALKTDTNLTAKAIRQLKSVNRWCVTGTPVENQVSDLFSLLKFIQARPYGTKEWFSTNFVPGTKQSRVIEALASTTLRRTKLRVAAKQKKEGKTVLPRKLERTLRLALSADEQKFYEDVANGVSGLDIPNGLVRFLKLRQAADARATIKDRNGKVAATGQSSKLETLVALIQELRTPGSQAETFSELVAEDHVKPFEVKSVTCKTKACPKVVVFSQWTTMLDLVRDALTLAGIATHRIDGDVPSKERSQVVAMLDDDTVKEMVVLVSLKAGGTGLNLQKANALFLVDPWFNPAVEHQAIDRIHRMRSPHEEVYVYRLLAANTAEDRVEEIKDVKKELYRQTIALIEDGVV